MVFSIQMSSFIISFDLCLVEESKSALTFNFSRIFPPIILQTYQLAFFYQHLNQSGSTFRKSIDKTIFVFSLLRNSDRWQKSKSATCKTFFPKIEQFSLQNYQLNCSCQGIFLQPLTKNHFIMYLRFCFLDPNTARLKSSKAAAV